MEEGRSSTNLAKGFTPLRLLLSHTGPSAKFIDNSLSQAAFNISVRKEKIMFKTVNVPNQSISIINMIGQLGLDLFLNILICYFLIRYHGVSYFYDPIML